MRTLRMLALGTLTHVKQMSRSPFEVTIALVVPIVQATLAVYLFRAGQEQHQGDSSHRQQEHE